MAKFEIGKILGSSQNNFLIFHNNDYKRPTVTFYFTGGSATTGEIVIRDAIDEDGYNKTIAYSPDDIITDSSFRCTNDNMSNILSLMECLRKNQIFFDLEIVTDVPNIGTVIQCRIDSSTKYQITTGAKLVVEGTYSSYNPKEPNKFVLLENAGGTQITLEKYSYNDEVSFNVTAPYEHLSFKDPKQVNLIAYRVDDNSIYGEAIQNNSVVVFPTTLTKFQDTNLADFYYSYEGQKVNFLTNKYVRSYNYGEKVALSVLTDKSIGLKKKYYTVSGKYLSEDTSVLRHDNPYFRHDFYFDLNITGVESSTSKQVGYCLVTATYNGNEITNPIRYNIEAKCNQNNEIFFVNEVGGIDSFNFLGERSYKSKISNQETYFSNPIRMWSDTKEIEAISQKKNNVEHVLTSTIIDYGTSRWLNEISKTKYAFLYNNNSAVNFTKIIITDVDINLSDRENTFEVEITYQDSDNNIIL